MPNKKLPAGQSGSIKKFRSDVAKLKAVGLVSKRVDARSQRDTKYMRSQVRKFNDVLTGKAKVAVTPSRAAAKEYGEAYKTKGKRVVVPVETKAERVRYRAGHIESTRPGYKQHETAKKIFQKTGEVQQPLPPGYVYTIPLGQGFRSFDTWSDAVIFMAPYEAGPHKYHGALGDWTRYLIIERYEDAGDSVDA